MKAQYLLLRSKGGYSMLEINNLETYGWEAAIPNFPGYKVTKDGQVIGKRGKPMKGHIDRCGYREVILSYYPDFQKNALVHRLVLSTFNPIENMEFYDVNHINGNKLDNRLENLEWCTRSQNIKHSYEHELQTKVTNPHGTYRVLTKNDLDAIIQLHKFGLIDSKIANYLGCSRSLISRKIREMGLR